MLTTVTCNIEYEPLTKEKLLEVTKLLSQPKKTNIIFDRIEIETPKKEEWFKVGTHYWMKLFNESKKKKQVRYMFHRKRRIQKKWDKIYNDKFEIIYSPRYIITNCTV